MNLVSPNKFHMHVHVCVYLCVCVCVCLCVCCASMCVWLCVTVCVYGNGATRPSVKPQITPHSSEGGCRDGVYEHFSVWCIWKKKKNSEWRVRAKSLKKWMMEELGIEGREWSTREKISVELRSEDYRVITKTSSITINRALTRQSNWLSNQRIHRFDVKA